MHPEVAIFPRQTQIFALPGDEMAPGDKNRRKSPERIDDANALVWSLHLHVSMSVNVSRYPASITEECDAPAWRR